MKKCTLTFRAFSRCFYPTRFTTLHPHIHTQTVESTMLGTTPARSSGAFRVKGLAQGHLDTLGGAGVWTGNLPVTSQPALPPELS